MNPTHSENGSIHHRFIRRSFAMTSMLVLGTLAEAASAQGSPVPLKVVPNHFTPAPTGDRMFAVQSPYVAGESVGQASLMLDYARNPLAGKQSNDPSVSRDQLFLHFNAGFAFRNTIAVNASFPIGFLQGGSNGGTSSGVSGGDLRLGWRVNLIGTYWDPFQLALAHYTWLPLGNAREGKFVGEGARDASQIIMGGRVKDRAVWSFELGNEYRYSRDDETIDEVSSTVRVGAGVGFLFADGNLQFGPELTTALGLNNSDNAISLTEVLLNTRYRFLKNFEVGVALGTGISTGSEPVYGRAIGMLAYTPKMKKLEPPKPMDTDSDGIIDAKDACLFVKGVVHRDPMKNGCPRDSDGDFIIDASDACVRAPGVRSKDPNQNGCPPDADGDQVLDGDDACPRVKGERNPDMAKNGCPPDRDGDGVIDAEDACVDIKGLMTTDPATNGCPGDTDGDTIRDDQDACPNEKGLPNSNPKKNGCPTAVRVTDTEVVILQQVQFDTGAATIKTVSDPLLDEVASALTEHPEINLIEVQGHTDTKGMAYINKRLSQARAESVKKALVERGIAPGRLVATGYGSDKSIGDNATEEGRQQNRRVQFVIVEKAAVAP